MKHIIILTLILTSCDQAKEMTNDQIIAETKKCRDAGFTPQVGFNGWNGRVLFVQCLPRNAI